MSDAGALMDLGGQGETLIADIRRLVECESPSSDLGAVARSADVVAAVGEERLGMPPERIVIDGCTHLRWKFDDAPTRVLILCHHDTVWPIGSLEAHPFTVADGVLRGPGSFDMKAGLAVGFHAAARVGSRVGVTILVTGDEEIGSPTSRALIEREAAGAAAVFVLEASADEGALKTARKGVSLYTASIHGRAAHAGLEPEKGINATVELAHQVLAVAALGDAALGTTVTPTVATSGTTSNTVAATASFTVDVRSALRSEQDRVDDEIRRLAPVLDGARIEVSGGINRAPLESTASAGLFALAQTVAGRLGLPALRDVAVGGASDGNFTAALGVPTLDGLGAVGGGAHAVDEHVLTDFLLQRTALLAGLLDAVREEERAA